MAKHKSFDTSKYKELKFKNHRMMDEYAGKMYGEDWLSRVNRPGTIAGSGRWHYHQLKGKKNAIIEDTLKGRLYIRKNTRR